MSEGHNNVVLALLRRIESKIDRLAGDMREVKSRLDVLIAKAK